MTTLAHANTIGYLAASVQKTRENKAGDTLLGTFVTATVYCDFSPKSTSIYKAFSGGTATFETGNIGTYGELSRGGDYLKVLNPGAIFGAKQFNASVRLDGRFSSRVHSVGLTAQVRLQF